jgi:hypothetical protein
MPSDQDETDNRHPDIERPLRQVAWLPTWQETKLACDGTLNAKRQPATVNTDAVTSRSKMQMNTIMVARGLILMLQRQFRLLEHKNPILPRQQQLDRVPTPFSICIA